MSEAKISEAAVHAALVEWIANRGTAQEDMRAAITAALPHLHPQPAELAFDVEAMLTACVPGGSIVDPQVVADNIRAWAAERKPAELDEQQGVREKFEAWAKSAGLETKIYAHNDMYSHPVTRGAWIAWESLVSTQAVATDPVSYEYRFWNPDAKGGDGAWSGWGPIRKADYERELVEPVEGREVRALCVAKPDRSVYGYQRAFYELADMLDMGAQPISPKQAWETQMRPMLQAALAATGKRQVGEAAILRKAAAVLDMWEGDPNATGYMGDFKDACAILEVLALHAAPPAQQADQEYLESLDRALEGVIDQRDRYHEVADDIAGHISAITGVDIGEHSSANCPWQNAIEAAESYSPAQGIDLGQQQDAARWRAIAPLLSVEWDEDEQLKRWTWIDFKGDAPAIPSPTRQEYASVDEAVDALIDQRDAAPGVGE